MKQLYRMVPRLAVCAALATLVAAGVSQWGNFLTPASAQLAALQSFPTAKLTIHTRSGERHVFTVEVARTPSQQAQGLMFRRHLAADAGMLFLYDRVERTRMWMKNTYIPLDMLFIAVDGKIVDLAQRTVPLSVETVAPDQPVRAVLELNAGTVSRLGLGVGDWLEYPAFSTGSK